MRDAPGPVSKAQLTAAGAGGRKFVGGKRSGRGSTRMSPSPRRSGKRGAEERSPAAGRSGPGKVLAARRISDGYAAESVRSSTSPRPAAAVGASSGSDKALRERLCAAEDSAAAAAEREETIHAELGGLQQEMLELMARLQRSEQAVSTHKQFPAQVDRDISERVVVVAA